MTINEHIEINVGPPPIPKFAIIAIVVLVMSVVSIFVFIKLNQPQSVVEEINPGQDLIVTIENVTFYVPNEAITMAGVISISSLEPNLFSGADTAIWARPEVVNIEYRNEEGSPYSHVTFPVSALVCFKVNETDWQNYLQHPDEYQVQYYAEENNPPGWVSLPLVHDPNANQLCGQTTHLSIFALAVKPQADMIPNTGGIANVTPTGSLIATAIGTPNQFLITATPGESIFGSAGGGFVISTPVSTQAALSATSVALTATDVPPTAVPPTAIPPTAVPPTAIPPTNVPPTAVPPTAVPPTPIPPTPEPPTPEPTQEPTEPPDPTGEPTEPPDEPTEPPDEPTEPPDEPTEPPDEPTEPPVVEGLSPILEILGLGL